VIKYKRSEFLAKFATADEAVFLHRLDCVRQTKVLKLLKIVPERYDPESNNGGKQESSVLTKTQGFLLFPSIENLLF
jgi:hypothetical protein